MNVDRYIDGLLADDRAPPAPAFAGAPSAPVPPAPSLPPASASPAPPAAEPASRPKRWLCFEIAGQSYGIELLKVQEVQRVPEIVPLRGAAPELLGVTNLRGQIVHVVDLALKLGFAACDARAETARIVVLEERGEAVGLLVSAVAEIATLDQDAIERVDAGLRSLPHRGLLGIARRARAITALLDGAALLQ